jgi:site-specific DNA recombinase
LSEVTLRGAKSHAALGHSAGGSAPFGYDRLEIDSAGQPVRVMNTTRDWKSNKLNRVVWIPSDLNAPVVRWIFETYESGTGTNLLVQQLNQRNIPAPRGRYWSKTMVRYLLQNRAYLGERSYNKRSYKAFRRGEAGGMDNPKNDWVIKENAHPPIIERDLFERVQAARKTKIVSIGRTFHRPYLLTGIARCANCGYRMIGQPTTGNGHKYLSYTCSGYLRIGKSVCRSVHVLSESVEREVVQSIREHLATPEWKVGVRETLRQMINDEFGDSAQPGVDAIRRQLAEIDHQIVNIIGAIKMSGRFSDAMNETLANLEAQKQFASNALSEFENARIGNSGPKRSPTRCWHTQPNSTESGTRR